MLRKEWPLIANSIIIQLAAGLFTFLAAYRQLLIDQAGSAAAIAFAASGMMLSGPLIIIGMILSLFHLGQPSRACRALTHIGASWLSREVILTGAFLVLWMASTWMDITGSANMMLVWLTVAAGFLCVVSMSGIYSKTGKPGWSGIHSYYSFFATLIVFGSVGSAIVMISSRENAEIVQVLPLASILLALLLLAVRFIYQHKLFSTLKAGPGQWSLDQLVAASPLPLPAGLVSLHQSLTLWGGALSFSGVALALYALTAGGAVAGTLLLILIAGLVLAGELLQRMGFNSLGLSSGMADQ